MGEPTEIRGQRVRPLQGDGLPPQASFPVSFEQATEQMQHLPRMFVEPDGSFVWTGEDWQLDGNLFDRSGRLLFVELKGSCREGAWEALLRCCGWPGCGIMLELTEHGVYLDETEFRRFAAEL